MKKTIMILAMLAVAACGGPNRNDSSRAKDATGDVQSPQLAGSTFIHNLFPTKADCVAAHRRPGGDFVNCFQSARFGKDGKVALLVTDIMNLGTYTVSGSKVILTFPGGGELPSFVFTVNGDGTLTDAQGNVWQRSSAATTVAS